MYKAAIKKIHFQIRMRALLDQEVDMEELFEYRDSDEEDEEFFTKSKTHYKY